MKKDKNSDCKIIVKEKKLIEKLDFYFENGLMVLTEHFLLKRGFCCENKCRNCPYKNKIS
jgi:hypothetical protein